MSTACLGEGGVVYKGSVTSGATAGHSFDSTLNPGKLPTVAGAKINIRVVDDVSECGVGSSIEGTTDSTGTYNVEATFAGAGEMRVTLCFTKTGYAPYRYVGEFPGGEDPTQGQLYLNVVLAPE
jgi:hypothetical protein